MQFINVAIVQLKPTAQLHNVRCWLGGEPSAFNEIKFLFIANPFIINSNEWMRLNHEEKLIIKTSCNKEKNSISRKKKKNKMLHQSFAEI